MLPLVCQDGAWTLVASRKIKVHERGVHHVVRDRLLLVEGHVAGHLQSLPEDGDEEVDQHVLTEHHEGEEEEAADELVDGNEHRVVWLAQDEEHQGDQCPPNGGVAEGEPTEHEPAQAGIGDYDDGRVQHVAHEVVARDSHRRDEYFVKRVESGDVEVILYFF